MASQFLTSNFKDENRLASNETKNLKKKLSAKFFY